MDHDVTVRIVDSRFAHAMEAAGWVERAVSNSMMVRDDASDQGNIVQVIAGEDGDLRRFENGEGFSDPGTFPLPHGLISPPVEQDRRYVASNVPQTEVDGFLANAGRDPETLARLALSAIANERYWLGRAARAEGGDLS
jgi:hypothetical protein